MPRWKSLNFEENFVFHHRNSRNLLSAIEKFLIKVQEIWYLKFLFIASNWFFIGACLMFPFNLIIWLINREINHHIEKKYEARFNMRDIWVMQFSTPLFSDPRSHNSFWLSLHAPFFGCLRCEACSGFMTLIVYAFLFHNNRCHKLCCVLLSRGKILSF